MKHDKPTTKYHYCVLCNSAIAKDKAVMGNLDNDIVYYCNLCLCEDCGKPLEEPPNEQSSSRFCNSQCQARFKGW